jgi:hypothetical protein
MDLALERSIAMVIYDPSRWPRRTSVAAEPSVPRRGSHPHSAGVFTPSGRALWSAGKRAAVAFVALGCSSQADKATYDPIALGMQSTGAAFYDDGAMQIYEAKRPVSLPIVSPSDAERASLSTPVAPYTRTPWITTGDVRVQMTWTLSNLDGQPHNIEILVDPWNEFVRYVPAVSVGEEEVVPDLSGIDLLIRVEAMQRKTGTFTFDDMDELATDLATVENILALNPPAMGTAMPAMDNGVNGMINHAFDIHNRSGDSDPLIQRYIPPKIAGLVGFDLGLRQYEKGTVAIEIVVEVTDVAGNRVIAGAPLKIDGSMWMTPDATVSAPMSMVR